MLCVIKKYKNNIFCANYSVFKIDSLSENPWIGIIVQSVEDIHRKRHPDIKKENNEQAVEGNGEGMYWV